MVPAQTRPTAPIRTVPLQDVQVRPPQRLTLRTPGEAKGLFSNFMAQDMTPTHRVAVWHPAPDSSRRYLVRTVRVRLGSRAPENPIELTQARRQFAEGYLALWLAPATATGAPADTNLLPAPLLLTPEVSARNKHGWVSFDVAAQQVKLPLGGAFVVAEGFANPSEHFVRSRLLLHPIDGKHPPEDYVYKKGGKSVSFYSYQEVRTDGSPSTRLVPNNAYPALLQLRVAPPAESRLWVCGLHLPDKRREWFALSAQYALFRQANPTLEFRDYNYDLELEVEEL
ncbi:MAG: hypothetical protein ACRYFX_28695 [Janthinobacterium lividum]